MSLPQCAVLLFAVICSANAGTVRAGTVRAGTVRAGAARAGAALRGVSGVRSDDLSTRVGEQVDAALESGLGPGVVVAVIENGKTVCALARGPRRIDEPDNLLKLTDKLHLGSCTKAITATLIGKLVDDGQLTFSATVAECMPEHKADIHADWQKVTCLELLQHRSGMPGNGPFFTNGGQPNHDTRLAIVMEVLSKPRPESLPFGKYAYSNMGYLLVATMAEERTRLSWEELIRTHVFEPLKMTSAGFGPPDANIPAKGPWGHRQFGDKYVPLAMDNPLSMAPAGCVHCTIDDWCRFIAFHMDEKCEHHQLLQPATLQVLHTAPGGQETAYAGGWMVKSIADQRVLWHNGSNTMWYAAVNAAPESATAVLVVSNGPIENQRHVEKLNRTIFESLFAAAE
ncbi:MAG: beta-lactamase family protein [Planctomycetaceae bacterium]|nr:beta-lactamase family protein [Planctomycetaceae bacterium]